MKFPPNIKIPDSLKRVLKRESTPDPLREPKRPIRRNPKDNIPLNFRERSNARLSLIASIVVLAILVLFFNQLDYRLIRKPAIDARKKATISKEKQEVYFSIPLLILLYGQYLQLHPIPLLEDKHKF